MDTTYKYKYKYKRKKIADVEDMDTTYKCLCAESAISCPELDHCAICYVSNYPTYQVWNKGKSGKNSKSFEQYDTLIHRLQVNVMRTRDIGLCI